ncbi:hypothetical protein NMY22_g15184 [Coprinellus aureogranulatus]|nr:hypothetical protein NMY22_g15184 [Coprinellus aureogranulatus]
MQCLNSLSNRMLLSYAWLDDDRVESSSGLPVPGKYTFRLSMKVGGIERPVCEPVQKTLRVDPRALEFVVFMFPGKSSVPTGCLWSLRVWLRVNSIDHRLFGEDELWVGKDPDFNAIGDASFARLKHQDTHEMVHHVYVGRALVLFSVKWSRVHGNLFKYSLEYEAGGVGGVVFEDVRLKLDIDPRTVSFLILGISALLLPFFPGAHKRPHPTLFFLPTPLLFNLPRFAFQFVFYLRRLLMRTGPRIPCGLSKTHMCSALLMMQPQYYYHLHNRTMDTRKNLIPNFERYGLTAVSINEDTPNDPALWKRIETGLYSVIICQPEQLSGLHQGHRTRLSRILSECLEFVRLICAICIDEAHFIYTAGKDLYGIPAFRPPFGRLGGVRITIGRRVPVMALSGTQPPHIKQHIKKSLLMGDQRLRSIKLSSNRPNLIYATHPLIGSRSDFRNLDFVIPLGYDGTLERTIVFHDDSKEAAAAAMSKLSPGSFEAIPWHICLRNISRTGQRKVALVTSEPLCCDRHPDEPPQQIQASDFFSSPMLYLDSRTDIAWYCHEDDPNRKLLNPTAEKRKTNDDNIDKGVNRKVPDPLSHPGFSHGDNLW